MAIAHVARQKRAALLEAIALAGGNITEACRQAQVPRRTHYEWVDADPEYASAVDQAASSGVEALEDEARRRGMLGVEEPVFHNGERVDVIRKYSDTLLIFLLKGAKPEKYRDNIAFKGSVDIANGGNELDAELRGFFAGMAAAREADVPADG